MAELQFDPIPTTAEELVVRWAQRDAEYAKRKPQLSAEEAVNVREARAWEAGRLANVKDRARMYARAKTWAPPSPEGYGSMKDWIE